MIKHYVKRWPKDPRVGKIYRARITGIHLSSMTPIIRWAVYTPKNRKVKPKK